MTHNDVYFHNCVNKQLKIKTSGKVCLLSNYYLTTSLHGAPEFPDIGF